MHKVDDVRIREVKELSPPGHLLREFPASEEASRTVAGARNAISRILNGDDDRLLVIVGPCSIHDTNAAREYSSLLAKQRSRLSDTLEVVMRVYFEKPRTTVGWKGLINDPDLDGSFNINKGLRAARELLLDINDSGLPTGTEYLDMISPQYITDLISWGAIGARTTESQVHRELASGLSCPVGFKNGTDGNLRIAIEAIRTASEPHHFLGVTKSGHSAIVSTNGNKDCHLILRGGKSPNYDQKSVDLAASQSEAAAKRAALMIDASHGNSRKDPRNQKAVVRDVAKQIANGETRIIGMMIESHLVAGQQELGAAQQLTYGQSITDGCIGWDETVELLEIVADAVQERRKAKNNRTMAEETSEDVRATCF